ncbi:hypothetical protein, partial [Hydrogenibacillus schlegelii]
ALALALTQGAFDAIAVETVTELRARLPAWLDAQAAETVASVEKSGTLSEPDRAALIAAVGRLTNSVGQTTP